MRPHCARATRQTLRVHLASRARNPESTLECTSLQHDTRPPIWAGDGSGSITVHFGPSTDNRVNCLPITDGWNYVVRLYKTHCKTPTETP